MRPLRYLLFLLSAVCLTVTASPNKPKLSPEALKAKADSAYLNNDYKSAAEHYEQLLGEGVDVEALYNLGNAITVWPTCPRPFSVTNVRCATRRRTKTRLTTCALVRPRPAFHRTLLAVCFSWFGRKTKSMDTQQTNGPSEPWWLLPLPEWPCCFLIA